MEHITDDPARERVPIGQLMQITRRHDIDVTLQSERRYRVTIVGRRDAIAFGANGLGVWEVRVGTQGVEAKLPHVDVESQVCGRASLPPLKFGLTIRAFQNGITTAGVILAVIAALRSVSSRRHV